MHQIYHNKCCCSSVELVFGCLQEWLQQFRGYSHSFTMLSSFLLLVIGNFQQWLILYILFTCITKQRALQAIILYRINMNFQNGFSFIFSCSQGPAVPQAKKVHQAGTQSQGEAGPGWEQALWELTAPRTRPPQGPDLGQGCPYLLAPALPRDTPLWQTWG